MKNIFVRDISVCSFQLTCCLFSGNTHSYIHSGYPDMNNTMEMNGWVVTFAPLSGACNTYILK